MYTSAVHQWHHTFAACVQNTCSILDLCNCKLSSPLYPACQILFFSLSIFLLCFCSGFSRKMQLWWALPEIAAAVLLIHLNYQNQNLPWCVSLGHELLILPLSLIFGSLNFKSRVSQLTSTAGKQPWRRIYGYLSSVLPRIVEEMDSPCRM